MSLPNGTQVADAYAFISLTWSTFAIFGTIFAIIVGPKIASFFLKIVKRLIPS